MNLWRATATGLEKCFILEKACDGIEETYRVALDFAGGFDKDRKLIAAYKQKLHGDSATELVQLNLEYFKGQRQV